MLACNSLINPMPVGFVGYITSVTDKSHLMGVAHGLRLTLNTNAVPVINPDIIKSYGGKEIQLNSGENAFREGDLATHYFQIVHGSIKMFTISANGKEFIQGMFKTGNSFGEPPLFCDFPYPSTACAIGPSTLLKLQKDKFLILLRDNFEVHLLLNRLLCQRLKYKSLVLSEISSYDPAHRIMSLLKYLKSESRSSLDGKKGQLKLDNKYIIPFTRQQLADMSGLRVETVIRTVKKMDREGKLKLAGRKITI